MTDTSTRGDGPHGGPSQPTNGRRRLRRLAIALTTSVLLVGPWPVDEPGPSGGEPFRRSAGRIDALPGPMAPGPIRVGVAEVDITPRSPRPLAGFIGQVRTPFAGIDTRCFARALTVERGSLAVTVLTADLLLINAKLARAVVDRAGVRPDEVYFTASHTHGGPGGWGEHPLERLVAGAYDPAFFDALADQLADAVRRSRAATEPAEVGFVQARPRGRQSNRVDPSLPTHDPLSSLVFRPAGASPGTSPIAVLAVFGAHATVSHPVPPRLGGDYPAALASELKRTTGARMVLFASGAVGDASPQRPQAGSPARSAELLGRALAGDLASALGSARFEREPTFGNVRLDVDLPTVRLPFFSPWLRFSPALTWWIADRRTHLHALRIGPAVLLGFPGDYSGHLADRLEASTRSTGLATVATSFDGDFRGYLVSGDVFRRRGCYETRWMSFYGAGAGDSLTELARRLVVRLSGSPLESPAAGALNADTPAQVALAALIAVAWLILRPGRDQLAALRGRVGWMAPALGTAAVLAFLVAPDAIDWAKVGMPAEARFAGIGLGLVGLAGAKRRGAAWAAWWLGAGCGLLASSWVVGLMLLRARAVLAYREVVAGSTPAGVHPRAGGRAAPAHQS